MKEEIKSFENCKFADGEICVDTVSVLYTQNGDCTEGEDEVQELTISSRNNGMARFINIKTGENGWSIDDIPSLAKIIDDFKKRADIKDEK